MASKTEIATRAARKETWKDRTRNGEQEQGRSRTF